MGAFCYGGQRLQGVLCSWSGWSALPIEFDHID